MQFAGVLPPDAPDPMDELRARVRTMAFPVMGLLPQPTVEDHGSFGLSDGRDSNGLSHQSVSISYTLWRYPDTRSSGRSFGPPGIETPPSTPLCPINWWITQTTSS